MQAGAHFRLAHSCRNAQDATLREALHSRTHAPVSVPTAANALPVRTATALPPLLPPGDLRPARLVRGDANIDARRHAGVWTPLTWLVSSHQRADGRPVGTEHVEGPHAELVLRFAQQMIVHAQVDAGHACAPCWSSPQSLRRQRSIVPSPSTAESDKSATFALEQGQHARLNGWNVAVQHPGRGSRPDAPHAEVVLKRVGDTVSDLGSGT